MHLTNYSLNKFNKEGFVKYEEDNEENASKRSVQTVLSLSHTHTLSLSLSFSISLAPSLSLSLSLTHTHTHRLWSS